PCKRAKTQEACFSVSQHGLVGVCVVSSDGGGGAAGDSRPSPSARRVAGGDLRLDRGERACAAVVDDHCVIRDIKCRSWRDGQTLDEPGSADAVGGPFGGDTQGPTSDG